MEPSGRRIEQPWLTARGAGRVMEALGAQGATARFVGGCVRDALASRAVRDIDIAIDCPPETTVELAEAGGLKAIPTGIDHGTVTVVAEGKPYEVTTLRVDVETDGRRAVVAFTDDWLADAGRRDFTFNALYCDPDGMVYDPVGGIPDLETGTVRFIGDATERIAEDALRILRFFRFHAWYGRGGMDAEGLAACKARRDDIGNLSIERVRAELLRLLEAESPLPALREMEKAGILGLVLPEALHVDRLETLVEQGAGDAFLRLAVLTDRRPETLSGLAARLKLSNREKKRLRCMAAGEVNLPADMEERALYAQAYWLGTDRVTDLAQLDSACDGRDRGRLMRALGGWQPPEFPMTGADLVRLNIPRGPQLGETLRRLEAWWVEQDFEPDRGALRLHLASLMDED